ncbi:MAG TPA: alpha/beta hydrolase [Candidatus Limnocylindria bacterium]|nr:alpha/beta hydrolase [Candidatus Limnocylindria bacterium]
MGARSTVLPSSDARRFLSWRPSWGGAFTALGRVIVGFLIAIAIVVALAAVTSTQTVSLPAVTGSSAVGRTELTLVDTSRTDPFQSDGRSRELAIWIWYPTQPDSTAPSAAYFPMEWAALPQTLPFRQDPSRVTTNSHEGAALDGVPPVVVLQPGLGQPVGNYSSLAEELASHGYAVVGINETGSAPAAFPDGHVVAATAAGNVMAPTVDEWYEEADRVTSTWATDAQFVVESLEATPPAIGALDFSRVAFIGHSLGGASAFEACSRHRRCAAAIDLDGTLWTAVRHTGLSAPHLLVQKEPADACDEFCTRASADFAAVMAEGGRQIAIAGATHPNFQDDGLMPAIVNRIGLGSINGRRMTDIVRDSVRAFLDVHVLGGPASQFDAALDRYPEVAIIR